MDNDILINQARRLYTALQIMQTKRGATNVDRLKRLAYGAYARYQRRLNRCTIFYQYRNYDCIREPGEKLIPCDCRKFESKPPFCIE